jgi:hypothetical protein
MMQSRLAKTHSQPSLDDAKSSGRPAKMMRSLLSLGVFLARFFLSDYAVGLLTAYVIHL